MTVYSPALAELSRADLARLDAIHDYAVAKYNWYRRGARGRPPLDPDAAFRAALAWGMNCVEQRVRDYAHDTGAVPL